MTRLWQRYQKGNPVYLARNYWWAYLSPLGVWFFSHRIIVNLILYGQYRNILNVLRNKLQTEACGRMLQISCAYGDITPTLADYASELHQNDVALIQLKVSRNNLAAHHRSAHLTRMNAENLGYASHSFQTVVIFFLLHELPADARNRVLSESLRVLQPGGRLFIADYAPNMGSHLLHRKWWTRLVEYMEPFLHNFWHSDLTTEIATIAHAMQRNVALTASSDLFKRFYRVEEYRG